MLLALLIASTCVGVKPLVSRAANQVTVVTPAPPAVDGAVLAAAELAAALAAVLAEARAEELAEALAGAVLPVPAAALAGAAGTTVAVGVPPQAARSANAPEAAMPFSRPRRERRLRWKADCSPTFVAPWSKTQHTNTTIAD